MSVKNVKDRVRELLADWLPPRGYELWNVEFVKAGASRNLNVYVDKASGMSADDCEVVSRYLSEKLDEEELITGNYYLIVSSPGMDRTLLTDEHFTRYKGSAVDITLYKGVNGRKAYGGVLGERTADTLYVVTEDDGIEVALPRELVSKVRLQVRF
ncbi:MAG: ribosome maturation factor RimP [Clostridiales Family XIII bacterium]|jgi:ribosome maturation factor RimP|nr:ribosome maturation factor RimP [Clostridiales Family XIII bacterium]